MKRVFVLVWTLLAAIITGCQESAPPVDLAAEKAGVASVLTAYVAAVEAEDMEAYAANMMLDSTMINFGALGPPIIGWSGLQEVMKGQNESLADIKIDVRDLNITVAPSGDNAWATSLWTFKGDKGGTPVELPVRCTWILQKQQGKWIIVHFHKSIAAG